MLTIGLTGGFATGKSTVAAMFAGLGAHVIDADRIVHQLLRPGQKCYRDVVKTFGREILKQKRIDRRKLGEIVFGNRTQLKKLENIIHPEVRKVFRKKLRTLKTQKRYRAVILDVPLLFESGLYKDVDMTIVVKSTQDKQVERAAVKFNITKAEALRRIRAQMPLRRKIRLADAVIDNNESKSKTKKQVVKIWQKV